MTKGKIGAGIILYLGLLSSFVAYRGVTSPNSAIAMLVIAVVLSAITFFVKD